MTIRGRLLTLAMGGVLPLLIFGLIVLWIVWKEKQNQLNEGLEQQAELAAVVFDRWLDGQYQPLKTIASYPPKHFEDKSALEGTLKAAVIHRPGWIDLRVLDTSGKIVSIYPANAESLPDSVTDKLLAGMRRGLPTVDTDWERGQARNMVAIALPVEGVGVVVARIDGAALKEPFSGMS